MKNKLTLSAIAIILGACTSQNTKNMEAGVISALGGTSVSYQKQLLEKVENSVYYGSKVYLITIDTTKVLWISKDSKGGDALVKLN